MHLEYTTPSQIVVSAANLVYNFGSETNPRGQKTREILNATFAIKEPWQIPFNIAGRQLRDFIGAIEALQLVGQISKPEQVTDNVKAFEQFTDNGIFHGSYGVRIYGKLQSIVDVLQKDPDSRQAVLTLFNSHQDLNTGTKDTPCTLSLQFFIRKNKLCARTTMRSNDVWLGLPYDLIQFAALQGAIAKALDLPMGWYSHSVGSLHLYENNFDQAPNLSFYDYPESKPYQALWSGNTIEEISKTARRILDDKNHVNDESTSFEKWLSNSIHEKDS